MAKHKLGGAAAAEVTANMGDFQAEDDLRTLTRAGEIHQDPSRVRKVRKHLSRQRKSLLQTHRALGGKR